MMESSGASDRISCAEAGVLLEKRISEEILSDAEQQALTHHENDCPLCREVVKWISILPQRADDLSEIETLAARKRFVENRGRLEAGAQRRKKVWALVGAAAAIAAVVLVGVFRRSSLPIASDEGAIAINCVPALPTEPVPGVFMTYCDDKEPGVLIVNGGDVRVSLRDGAVGLRIDPKRRDPHKVVVDTPEGEVRVKGTVFTVELQRDSARVEVFRGVVEFVPKVKGVLPLQVAAGRGADLMQHQLFDLSSPRTEPLRRALEAKLALKRQAENETVGGESAAAQASAERSPPFDFLDSGTADGLEEQAPVAPVESGEMETEATADGFRFSATAASKRSPPSIDALVQDAQSCLIDRDWTCAAARYQDVLKHYPGRPESTAVLISLAKIELLRLHLPKKALDHYELYQRQAPRGPMAEEALFGIAEACRRLGQQDREAETLRLFVERYPQSSQLEKARARLHQLAKN